MTQYLQKRCLDLVLVGIQTFLLEMHIRFEEKSEHVI